MPHHKMKRIAKPAAGDASVVATKKAPAFRGEGKHSYHCPACDTPILKNVNEGQCRNMVFRCPLCEAYLATD